MNQVIEDPNFTGVLAAIASCLIFLIFHQLTISNIWFSSPFMFLISGLAGYSLTKTYFVLFSEYTHKSWMLYCLYFTAALCLLSFISVLVFEPKYTSTQIISSGGAPPSDIIVGALPLTILWTLIVAVCLNWFVTRSLSNSFSVIISSMIIFLTLGLNVSILGYVSVANEHKYLVEKFLLMNAMVGGLFMLMFMIMKPRTKLSDSH